MQRQAIHTVLGLLTHRITNKAKTVVVLSYEVWGQFCNNNKPKQQNVCHERHVGVLYSSVVLQQASDPWIKAVWCRLCDLRQVTESSLYFGFLASKPGLKISQIKSCDN